MTSKQKLLEALKNGSNGTSIAYGYTKKEKPYIIFNLVSNVSKKLSNQRHHRKFTWQVDYYSLKPLDIEGTELSTLLDALEDSKGITTEWLEISDVDEDTELVTWRYMIEVII